MDPYDHGHDLLQRFIRGDAMIGLIPDVPATERAMLDALWAAATAGDARAYLALSECYLAALRPLGAFDGVDPADAAARPWSIEAQAIVDAEQPALEATLRCQREAARLGARDAVANLTRLSRHSAPATQRLALGLLDGFEPPTPAEQYLGGLVAHWLGDTSDSLARHRAAADAGDADAQFELSLYYGQGIGVAADPATAATWLARAADGGHARALYNLGARLASGADGEVDLPGAAVLYQRAVEAGHGRAAATLAVMMLTGELDGDLADACALLDRADAAGFEAWEMLDAVGLDDPRAADGGAATTDPGDDPRDRGDAAEG